MICWNVVFRYTELLKLEYFEPFNANCHDVMHNIFLGTPPVLMEEFQKESKYNSDVIDARLTELGVAAGLRSKVRKGENHKLLWSWGITQCLFYTSMCICIQQCQLLLLDGMITHASLKSYYICGQSASKVKSWLPMPQPVKSWI